MRILDDMDHILETKCLTQDAMNRAVFTVQKELNLNRIENSLNVLFFNRMLELCALSIGAHLRREVTIDEKIYIGHQVYIFLVTRSQGEPWGGSKEL